MPKIPKQPKHLAPGMASDALLNSRARHSRNTRLRSEHDAAFAEAVARAAEERERERKEAEEREEDQSSSESDSTHHSQWTPPDLQHMSTTELGLYHERNREIIGRLKPLGLHLYVEIFHGLARDTYHSISIPSRPSPFYRINETFMRYHPISPDRVIQEVLNPQNHDEIFECEVSPILGRLYWKVSGEEKREESLGVGLSGRKTRIYGFSKEGGEGRRRW